jgi:D-alanyl-D-alanine endopeptidase (penicillin-binding protein 7)
MTPMLNTTGWTLIHFTWQGALVAGMVAIALRLAGPRAARLRARVCAGLCAMLAAPSHRALLRTAAPTAAVDDAGGDRLRARRAPERRRAHAGERALPDDASPRRSIPTASSPD